MSILDTLTSRARAAQRTIVLPEGRDPRVAMAAVQAAKAGICRPILLGTPTEIEQAARTAGVELPEGVAIIDYTTSDLLGELAAALHARRRGKGMTQEEALATVSAQPLYFGGMLVALGRAHGLVAGSLASTGDMLRSAFHCVGTAAGIKLASSTFIMDLAQPAPGGDSTLFFADCAVNPCPSAEELVDIAHATANTYRQIVGGQPRVAFLSFSTKGSARHELVDKMRAAAALTTRRFEEVGLDALVDGEMQADAALVPSVGAAKNKDGSIQGNANVLIFPDLQAGNIAYKLVERLAGATALGPVLQGLARPVNDLSRGCSVADIFGTMAITSLQAGGDV